jgi:SPP1 family predicted phage head-tail adaptor
VDDMLFRDVLDLITVTVTQNDIGDDIPTKTYNRIFCNKKSVRQSEFYQAMNDGLKPEYVFEVRSADYSNETLIRYNSKEYMVVRVNPKMNEWTEITVQGTVL